MTALSDLRATARSTMDRYTDPAGNYAFRTYDRLPLNDSDHLTPEDILAANLLSLKLSWSEVVPLFAEGEGPAQALLQALDAALVGTRESAPFETYASAAELDDALAPVAAANTATRTVPGWTPVTVSKVLHRHAPHAVPIIDSRVREFYTVPKGEVKQLRHRLWSDLRQNEQWLSELADQYATSDGRRPSLLRVADILIWSPPQ